MNPNVNQIYDSFAASYIALGRVADPTLAGDKLPPSQWYQCVSVIKPYLSKYGIIAGTWGNATAYWSATNNAITAKFQRLDITEPQKGDIVILGIDHIGISNGVVPGTSFQMLDQNGGAGTGTGVGSDAIQVHTFKKSQIIGVLRPIVQIVASAPAPAAPRYQVVETYPAGRLVRLNKQPTNLWGMNYSFDQMVKSPVEVHNAGEIWTVTNKVKHEDGYYYYRRDGQIDGFNVFDCDDYVAPAPIPVTTPAPPVPYTAAEQYVVVTELAGYASAAEALSPRPVQTTNTVKGRQYYVWTKNGTAYELTTDNQHEQPNMWINTLANVVPQPEPEKPPVVAQQPVIPPKNAADNAWKGTLTYLLPTHKSVRYRVLRDMYVTDLAGSGKGVEINMSKDDESTWLPIQYWVVRNNMLYLVPFLKGDEGHQYYYAIPTTDVDSGLPNLQSQLFTDDINNERDWRRSEGRMTFEDEIYYAVLATNQKISKLVKSGIRFLDGIIPTKKK